MGVLGHFGVEIGKFSEYIENSYLIHLVVQTCFRRVWEDGLTVLERFRVFAGPKPFSEKELKNDLFLKLEI